MSEFVHQAARYKTREPLPWLRGFQSRQASRWQQVAFPHRKTEDWKYTPLRALEQGEFFAAAAQARTPDAATLRQWHIDGQDSLDLVFVNGVFAPELSCGDTLPAGVRLVRFARADADEQRQIQDALGAVANKPAHLFAALNSSHLGDGVYIKIAKNTRVETPLRVVNVTLAQARGCSIFPRLLVDVDEGAEATVVEHFVSDDDAQRAFVNALTEISVQPNATLTHYRLHLEHESALHIGGVHANLHADAKLDSFQLALGAQLKRIDVVVNHLGRGAHCDLNGVYLPRRRQHVDFHTCVEHIAPRCSTDEVFRGIVGDSARAVFNGRIHIHRDAQKTLAQLSNKNLLTSNKAEVDTKPELEIYADDVQCAHGATVAQLDDNAMHYLMTRGVPREEARVMLSFGFINELVNAIRHPAIAAYLRPRLARLFGDEPELTRHIAS